jgi:hypothetical protein
MDVTDGSRRSAPKAEWIKQSPGAFSFSGNTSISHASLIACLAGDTLYYSPDLRAILSTVMKRTLYAICAIGVLIGNFGCTTAGDRAVSTSAPSAPAVVKVDFVAPDRFTDFRINNRDFQHSSTVFTRDVTAALLPVMARRFPGHTLNLRYTNIDLVGRRTSGPQGLGVVSGSTPPWLAFDYVLQNPSGRTIASGSRRLVAGAPASSFESRTHPVQIEADMMQRWLRTLRVPQ